MTEFGRPRGLRQRSSGKTPSRGNSEPCDRLNARPPPKGPSTTPSGPISPPPGRRSPAPPRRPPPRPSPRPG
ncbi:MAG TPA: hypothetical protein EYO97_10125 [Gemmatimonadetes bacterium]|nr:hypothetical protein [Gemmatimonadota bacterium]